MRSRDPEILAGAPWWRVLSLVAMSVVLAMFAVRESYRSSGNPLDHVSHFVPTFLMLVMSWSEAGRLLRYRKECQKVLPDFRGKAVSSLPAESAAGLRHDPATFAWFVGEWRRMAAHRTTVRLLFVDAPPAVLDAAGELLALTPNGPDRT